MDENQNKFVNADKNGITVWIPGEVQDRIHDYVMNRPNYLQSFHIELADMYPDGVTPEHMIKTEISIGGSAWFSIFFTPQQAKQFAEELLGVVGDLDLE